jgi:hypothetical protein
MVETEGNEMATFQEIMEGFGYIRQTTPAGRVIMVNPNFYPMSDADLAAEDDYSDEYYESRNAEQRAIDEDLGYGQPHSDDIDWGMSTYDDRSSLED